MIVQNVKHGQLEDKIFRFYLIMGYPIPINKDVFAYQHKKELKVLNSDFSWSVKPELMVSYLSYINKWGWVYKNLPFVKEIYLANSITFNSLDPDSDIDIFVICKNGRVRISRLFSSFLMMLFGIKRSKNIFKKKFCLSFFVDEDLMDLQKISLGEQDVYLIYRIAHLVPLYSEDGSYNIYTKNPWIKEYLPNIQFKQNIFLGNKYFKGMGLFKKCIEGILGGIFGELLEKFIQKKWGSRMKKNIAKNPDAHRGVIYEKGMLKFYKDMRKYYSDLFFSPDN